MADFLRATMTSGLKHNQQETRSIAYYTLIHHVFSTRDRRRIIFLVVGNLFRNRGLYDFHESARLQ